MMNEKTVRDMETAAWHTCKHAKANIEKWGLQDLKTLIVVATEELGETAREVLDYEHPKGRIMDGRAARLAASLERIHREAQDFAAVGLQIMVLVEKLKGDFESEVGGANQC